MVATMHESHIMVEKIDMSSRNKQYYAQSTRRRKVGHHAVSLLMCGLRDFGTSSRMGKDAQIVSTSFVRVGLEGCDNRALINTTMGGWRAICETQAP